MAAGDQGPPRGSLARKIHGRHPPAGQPVPFRRTIRVERPGVHKKRPGAARGRPAISLHEPSSIPSNRGVEFQAEPPFCTYKTPGRTGRPPEAIITWSSFCAPVADDTGPVGLAEMFAFLVDDAGRSAATGHAVEGVASGQGPTVLLPHRARPKHRLARGTFPRRDLPALGGRRGGRAPVAAHHHGGHHQDHENVRKTTTRQRDDGRIPPVEISSHHGTLWPRTGRKRNYVSGSENPAG